ncbi:MAG: hypothetical protein RSD68_07700, partial [Oscillospiraceae bacterium]
MALSKLTKDMNIVSALDDEPNDIGGLSSAQLKAKYDEGNKAIQFYINDTLLVELNALGVENILQTIDKNSLKFIRINKDGAIEVSADNIAWTATASSGHVILDRNGTALPQRSRMQFENCEVSDNGAVTRVLGVKGDKGDKGDTGIQGIQGIQGNKGDIGAAWYPALDGLGTLTFSLTD